MDRDRASTVGQNSAGGHTVPGQEKVSPGIRAAIREYFAMLEAELRGRLGQSDRRHWQAGTGADQVARERHQQHISGTLLDQGLPYALARPPLPGAPGPLRRAVGEYLRNHPEIFIWMESAVFRPEPMSDFRRVHLLDRLVDRPASPTAPLPPAGSSEVPLLGVDFLAGEQRNRSLARAGEALVLEFERQRLRAEGLHKYAEGIEHAAEEHGDIAGYDIQTWDSDGEAMYIRVKTTRFGRETPFYLSANELSVAAAHGSRYWIYRVFDFRQRPRLYRIRGPIDRQCQLAASAYRAAPL